MANAISPGLYGQCWESCPAITKFKAKSSPNFVTKGLDIKRLSTIWSHKFCNAIARISYIFQTRFQWSLLYHAKVDTPFEKK